MKKCHRKTILLQIKLWLRVRNLNKILIDSELQKIAYRIQFGFYNIKSVCLDTHYVLANLKTILHEYNVCSM